VLKNRQRNAIRNQLRTAIGVVQTKCAAVHYETKIAELHQAGADIADFGHSRMLFPQMIDVACHFIDQETKEYLLTNLPNTGLPPHYYVSADKSTNHRVSNQVTMVYPVIEGKKTAIPMGMNPVYSKLDGSGGKGEELAEAISKDLKNHLGVEGESLLQMQGKVTDGQFVTSMNKPIFDVLYSAGLSKQELAILLENRINGGNVIGTQVTCSTWSSPSLKRTVLSSVFLEEFPFSTKSFAMAKCMPLQKKQPRN
jgi:hypothetical protein